MSLLKPEQVAAYFDLFDELDAALVQVGVMHKRNFGLVEITPLTVLLKQTHTLYPDRLKRRYERSRQGHKFFTEEDFFSIVRLLRAYGISSQKIDFIKKLYDNCREGKFKTTLRDYIANLASPSTIDKIFGNQADFAGFWAKASNKGTLVGLSGHSITNCYAISKYLLQIHNGPLAGSRSTYNRELIDEFLLIATRHGAYLAQSIGKWGHFDYFARITNLLASEGNVEARIIALEHKRHRNRFQQITTGQLHVGAASEALGLALSTSGKSLADINFVTLINAVDEFAEVGFPSDTRLPNLDGLDSMTVLEAAQESLKRKEKSSVDNASFMIVKAEQAISDGYFDRSEDLLGQAALEIIAKKYGSLHRSIVFVRGKCEAAKGRLDNSYFKEARDLAVEDGAYHIVADIDNRLKRKRPYQ